MKTAAVILCVALSMSASPAPPPGQPAAIPVYKIQDRPVDERVRDLLSRMTIEEKFWQLFMIPGDLDDPAHDYSKGVFGLQIRTKSPDARAHAERINAIQRYFVEQDAPRHSDHPVRGGAARAAHAGRDAFPQAIGLAATWDPPLMDRVAGAIARETRTRGIRQVLSPVVNIADDVRWGRVEETYGEDPYLSSVMGRAFIEPFERAGIVATPKHFVANVGEGGRDSYPDRAQRAAAEERFFPPFEVAVRGAGARSVMTAYNSVDGSPATQNRRLLTGVLKREWRFRGFVISDAAATGGATVLHHTEASTRDGDEERDSSPASTSSSSRPGRSTGRTSRRSRAGRSVAAAIDAAVSRVLRAKFELGLFENPYVDPEEAARWNGHADHRALAREAAQKSIVLLKNERGLLPLAANLKRIAVIGVDATEVRLGGYSGPGVAPVSILDGLRERLGNGGSVRHARGPGRHPFVLPVIPADWLSTVVDGATRRGLRGEYFSNNQLTGAPRAGARRRTDGLPLDAEFAGPRHSLRLVLGPLDRHAHGAAGRCATHRRRGQRRVSPVCRRSTRHRQLAQAVVRRAYRGREPAGRIDARHPARILREHRQRASQTAVGCRRRGRRRGDVSTRPWRLRSRVTSRSSSPASRKGSFATGRASRCRGARKS